MGKNAQNSNENTNAQVVDLGSLVKPKASKTKESNPNATPKNDSAYSLLKQAPESVAKAFGLTKLARVYDHDAKCFFISNDPQVANIDPKNINALHQIAAGEATIGEGMFVKKFTESASGDKAEDIYNHFYNAETAPRTKSHAHGFYMRDNAPIFFCLQGSSVKVIEL